MEWFLFIGGCLLSYISGVFVYSFLAGIVSGIFLLKKAKQEENKNNKITTEDIKDIASDLIEDVVEDVSEKVEDMTEEFNEQKEKWSDAREEAKKVIEEAKEKLNDICNSLC